MDNQNGAWQPFTPITPPSLGAMACKRTFDIVCAPCWDWWCWSAAAGGFLLVAVTSPGGVFFRQERIGKGGKPFRIFKFRSMRKDNAYSEDHHRQRQPHHPRGPLPAQE